MAADCIVLAGPPASGKTDRLLDRYRGELAAGPPGAAVWLAPTWRAAADLRARLLSGGCHGCFSPGVMTFDQFAEAVLQVAPLAIRPISTPIKRQLIRRLIQQHHREGRLKHFGPIAETTGLVDLFCELTSELKRLEIWPEHFRQACHARGITQKDTEVLAVYEQYQQSLREHQLYDAEGRFWSARDLLGQGQRRPFERLRLVVADGFADFTRTQHEILEILAGWIEELHISLPLEAQPRRDELLAKPLATLAELRRRHPRLVVEELPRVERPWPAMVHLEKNLFADPRRVTPAGDTAGVEILAAGQELGEIELIGSRIKRLLTQGDGQSGGRPARPGEIAVVFRSLEDVAPLLAEVFGKLGIPFALEAGCRLDRSPVLAALVAVLRLDLDDWPFAQLLHVLSHNYFSPDWPEWQQGAAAAVAQQAIRGLQIPSGRETLLRELKTLAALALLRRLAVTLAEMPQQAEPAGWAKAWGRLAGQIGLLRAAGSGEGGAPAGQEEHEPPAESSALPDRLAWQRLLSALADTNALARWLGEQPPQWDRRQAFDTLLDIISSERMGPAGDESGRVRVLSAASARALRIPYLFFAGLSERAFPPPQRVDRLYGEAEYQRLIDEGLPLAARSQRNRDEMLLFYETMTRATRQLYLSYPALDSSARPLSPSPYLSEVQQASGRRIRQTLCGDLSPIPAGDEPLSAAEFRIKALSEALRGDVSLLAGLVRQQPVLAQNVLAGLELIESRRDRSRFGPAEGMLSGEALREELSARFSPEHTFAVTELEQYASCPYRFFLERVLRVELIEELILAVDYLQRGRLAHEVLAAFHRRVNESLGRPASPIELDPAEYDRLLGEVLQELSDEESGNPVQAALREVDRRLLGRWVGGYRDQHQGYDELWKQCEAPLVPEFFEVSFGRETGDEGGPSTAQALEFFAAEEPIGISGRIDRIDTGQVAGTTVFNVLDYKTGNPLKFNPESVAAGTTLQLPLYALAAAELLLADRDSVPWQVGYWYLKEKGFKQALQMYKPDDGGIVPDDQWEAIRVGLAKTVVALVRGIRGGQFPVSSSDDQCTGRCPFSTVCRINHVRALEKTWQPATESI